MTWYTEEFSTLLTVEEHLLNAGVSLRTAERRLNDGHLREQVRAIVNSVGEAVELTRRAKLVLVQEWRAAEGQPPCTVAVRKFPSWCGSDKPASVSYGTSTKPEPR